MRVDLLMVEKGLAPSRNRAQELIASGRVVMVVAGRKQPVKKPSLNVDSPENVSFEISEVQDEFVSRGGVKLKGALQRLKLDVKGFHTLDIGISTGGFTDCLLQAGAARVIGVDVGHGQLADKLSRDSRVKLIEGVNARQLSSTPLIDLNGGRKFDLVVIDVSFISLTLVLPEVISYLRESASIVALVKPQFEVGRENLGKNGIVKDASLYTAVEAKIRNACRVSGLIVEDYFESPIEGSDGNREFFVVAKSPELALDLFSSGRL
jgi:23S rRNA (cytidine1920-2'-O)/16S rRNA (cytidine1409-2'-O)-methyltransferase